MKNYTKKRIIFGTTLMFVFASSFLFNSISENMANQKIEGIITKPDDGTGPINLNAKEIKMKKVGDTFLLEASINSDASFDVLNFTSSDPSAISLKRMTEQSVLLTKLKDFTGLVTITIYTDDPFDDISTTCFVRAYNRVSDISGDIEWVCTYNGISRNYDNSYDIVFVPGATYKFSWDLLTIFSSYKTDENYKDTYCYLEEEDVQYLVTELNRVFKTEIKNVSVDETSYDTYHLLCFEIDYNYDLFESSNTYKVDLSIYEDTISWNFINYVGVDEIQLTDSLYVL